MILIDIQYLQNVVFSFEKDLNSQYHSSDPHYLVIQNSPNKISDFLYLPRVGEISLLPLKVIWKTLTTDAILLQPNY